MGRLRTNTNAPILLKEYRNYKNFCDVKLSRKPIYLEIGSGKGDFLIANARLNPKNFYIGIEKYSTVILKAVKKVERNKLKLNNLIFTCADANQIDKKKWKQKISKIYLNFSDPWPKKRHAKRRLTSNSFLDLYKEILIRDGIIEFKTDNDGLYKYTLETLKQRSDIKILYSTTDLYSDLKNSFNKNNVQTEYEKKFIHINKNIYKIIWFYRKRSKNI